MITSAAACLASMVRLRPVKGISGRCSCSGVTNKHLSVHMKTRNGRCHARGMRCLFRQKAMVQPFLSGNGLALEHRTGHQQVFRHTHAPPMTRGVAGYRPFNILQFPSNLFQGPLSVVANGVFSGEYVISC